MAEYSKPLGNAVKNARTRSGLTQGSVAEAIHIDDRTVLNIENYKGNPKMEILYPLIRALRIDPREIFYPEMQRESPILQELRLLIEDCDEQEAAALIPVFKSVIAVIRSKTAIIIK
ncbi:MAG: helix-turn-helix transcriptional regulator [Oscillospiraceae bacterium]|nr:helix-turn-helix transcriptional regulator [Oscillospiraceae bacterium]